MCNLLEDFSKSYADLFELYCVFNASSGLAKNEEELLNMKNSNEKCISKPKIKTFLTWMV